MSVGRTDQNELHALLARKIRDPRQREALGRMIEQWRDALERDATAADPSDVVMVEREALRDMSVSALLERFKVLAVAKDEAEAVPDQDRLYWQLDGVVRELEGREGDARHALLAFYTDADIRVRAEAATATRELVPELALDRLRSLDDPDWSEPASGEPRRRKLQHMTKKQLVERFVAVALDQDDALLKHKIARFNRLYELTEAVEEELKARQGDQRAALLPLLRHFNPQVRLKAAFATLAVAPEAARQALQAIVDRDEYPQRPDAFGMLRSLDDGSYKPS